MFSKVFSPTFVTNIDVLNVASIVLILISLQLGAFTVTMTDPRTGFQKYDTVDGDLTFLGRVMTDLPISQACTKLIMFGHCFGVMQEAIIIGT